MNPMDHTDLNWIANYIWGIASDILRDQYVRGKYRDVILPMTILRRLDVVLQDTEQAVMDMKTNLDEMGVVEQNLPLPSRSCPVERPPRIDNSRGCRYGRAHGTHHLTRPCHPDIRILGEPHHRPTPRDCRVGENQSRH